MSGYDIYLKALSLLGYKDKSDTDSKSLLRRAFVAVCEICSDLSVDPPVAVNEKIQASKKAIEAIPYGVAMLISLSEGDAVSNRFFTEVYNAKRAMVKAAVSSVADVIPTDNGGTV